jgi:nicotinamide mononucleotide transporter
MILSTLTHYLLTNWVELAGFITTALGIWLTTKRLLICWPVVLAADILYLVVFYRARLLSDALLQLFFIAFTLYGWWHWWRGVREEGEVRVEPLAFRPFLIAIAAGITGSFILGEIAKHLHAALPWLDAALASFSLVGSWWQARKHIANWVLWIVVNLIYIGEYIYNDLWITAVLYA